MDIFAVQCTGLRAGSESAGIVVIAVVTDFLPVDRAVSATGNNRLVGAAGLTITRVGCAVITVVTVQVVRTGAKTSAADIPERAYIQVVAGHRVVVVDATGQRVAGVVGADVAVVAVNGVSDLAFAGSADFIHGAGVTVVTVGTVIGVDAAGIWLAVIICADVAVVTIQCWPSRAFTLGTSVQYGTGITVITGIGVGCVLAPSDRVAPIIGTRVIVVAIDGLSGLAPVIAAMVNFSAQVSIVA